LTIDSRSIYFYRTTGYVTQSGNHMCFTQHLGWEPRLVYMFLAILLTGNYILHKLHKEYCLVAF